MTDELEAAIKVMFGDPRVRQEYAESRAALIKQEMDDAPVRRQVIMEHLRLLCGETPQDVVVEGGRVQPLDVDDLRLDGHTCFHPATFLDGPPVQVDLEGIGRWVCATMGMPADMAAEPEEFRVFRPWMDQWWGGTANVAGDSEEMEVCVAPRPDAPSLLQPSSLNHRYTIDLLPSPPPPLLIDILLLP
jgi:hypothetical protein